MKSFFKSGTSEKVSAPRLPKPRAKPSDMGNFAHVAPPKKPKLQTRIYTKSIAKKDPSEYMNIGFGQTGLTGES